MSGKPAARQGDMTQYGGTLVQAFSRGAHWCPHRRGLFGVPRRSDVRPRHLLPVQGPSR